jgi:hypothetical protein
MRDQDRRKTNGSSLKPVMASFTQGLKSHHSVSHYSTRSPRFPKVPCGFLLPFLVQP